jgi:transporter family-2 protein
MSASQAVGPRPLHLLRAFLSGGVLTLMILCNGTIAAATNGYFASLAPHATGTVAALVFLAVLPRSLPARPGRPPLWAYLGGLSGALTVMLTSVAMNSALALSGTIALGLAGQSLFGLASDRFGWFGMPQRIPGARDGLTMALVLAGSLIIIFAA